MARWGWDWGGGDSLKDMKVLIGQRDNREVYAEGRAPVEWSSILAF